MLGTTLPYYGFCVAAVKTERDEFAVSTQADSITLTLKSMMATIETNIKAEKLVTDMELMNKIRSSYDPAVKEAYEQLLTVMALTNGRVYNDDNDTTKKV